MKRKVYEAIASALEARENCKGERNAKWFTRHTKTAEYLTREFMPSGAGIDKGITLDLDKSTGQKLVFNLSFHHMNGSGMYDGWTDHVLTVRPSLTSQIELSISGRNRNDIKEYLVETCRAALVSTIELYADKSRPGETAEVRARYTSLTNVG